jgi:hypothetical protein
MSIDIPDYGEDFIITDLNAEQKQQENDLKYLKTRIKQMKDALKERRIIDRNDILIAKFATVMYDDFIRFTQLGHGNVEIYDKNTNKTIVYDKNLYHYQAIQAIVMLCETPGMPLDLNLFSGLDNSGCYYRIESDPDSITDFRIYNKNTNLSEFYDSSNTVNLPIIFKEFDQFLLRAGSKRGFLEKCDYIYLMFDQVNIHQNGIFMYDTGHTTIDNVSGRTLNKWNAYIYEPHGSEKVRPNLVFTIKLISEYAKNNHDMDIQFNLLTHYRKAYTGFQNITREQYGYCIMFTVFWFYCIRQLLHIDGYNTDTKIIKLEEFVYKICGGDIDADRTKRCILILVQLFNQHVYNSFMERNSRKTIIFENKPSRVIDLMDDKIIEYIKNDNFPFRTVNGPPVRDEKEEQEEKSIIDYLSSYSKYLNPRHYMSRRNDCASCYYDDDCLSDVCYNNVCIPSEYFHEPKDKKMEFLRQCNSLKIKQRIEDKKRKMRAQRILETKKQSKKMKRIRALEKHLTKEIAETITRTPIRHDEFSTRINRTLRNVRAPIGYISGLAS